jgi:hypothetical protein
MAEIPAPAPRELAPREPGWYWARPLDSSRPDWVAARWTGEAWIDSGHVYTTGAIWREIGPRIPSPAEQPAAPDTAPLVAKDTLELRAGPHRATVKVGDVVPMTDGTRWYVFERVGSGIGEHLSLHKPGTGPGTTSYYLNGHPRLGSGLPSIDIAALASQQPPAVTLTAAQVAEIRAAWDIADMNRIEASLRAVPGLLEDAPLNTREQET